MSMLGQTTLPINLLYLSMSFLHLNFLSTTVESIDQLSVGEWFQSLHRHYGTLEVTRIDI